MHGTHHKDREGIGYSFAVSGLATMRPEFEDMLKAEAWYWLKFKQQHDPDEWINKLERLEKTRGPIFVERLTTAMSKETTT